MHQLNVRNVDDALWRELKRRAAATGTSMGDLLNDILRDWLAEHQECPPPDARERAYSGVGILKDLAPGVSLIDDLFEMRRLDWEDEQRTFAEHSNQSS